jgi:hypothetical protein
MDAKIHQTRRVGLRQEAGATTTTLELLNDLLFDRTINVSLPFSEGLARPRQKPRNAIELLILLGRGLIDKRSCLHDL